MLPRNPLPEASCHPQLRRNPSLSPPWKNQFAESGSQRCYSPARAMSSPASSSARWPAELIPTRCASSGAGQPGSSVSWPLQRTSLTNSIAVGVHPPRRPSMPHWLQPSGPLAWRSQRMSTPSPSRAIDRPTPSHSCFGRSSPRSRHGLWRSSGLPVSPCCATVDNGKILAILRDRCGLNLCVSLRGSGGRASRLRVTEGPRVAAGPQSRRSTSSAIGALSQLVRANAVHGRCLPSP